MVIQIDTHEKARAITKIKQTFEDMGIKYISHSLPVGDYINLDNPRLIIDRKQNLSELCGNFSQISKKDKRGKVKRYESGALMTEFERFTQILKNAQYIGAKLIFLIEHGGKIKSLEDVMGWKNPRLKKSPLAMSGERLYKIMCALSNKYDIEWRFCTKAETGSKIIELLGEMSEREMMQK